MVLPFAPLDEEITIGDLVNDPYPIYARLRAETPVLRVKSVNRTLLTKAADTKYVKDNPQIFSSNDPNTPMERAFRGHTLMRKDGEAHARERNAMGAAFGGKALREAWMPIFLDLARDYVESLPTRQEVDLFTALAGPYSADCLKHVLGIPEADQADMQRWSQVLIDGAGNFGWDPKLFEECDLVNDEVDACMAATVERHRKEQGPSAMSCMINAENPIELSQQRTNIKIAIGGGINEPRDSLLTALYGLLTNPDQLARVKADSLWSNVFEEAIRWVAPIQVSSRLVTEDTEIRGFLIPKGDTLMTIQASANHDEDVYEEGHKFDVFRSKLSHQAFGNGPHFCQGTHIARRIIGVLILPMLFERFPDMKLAGPVQFKGFGFRGPASLPVLL